MNDIFLLSHSKYEELAKVYKAMAHPTRLLIIDALSRGERCVGELQEMVGNDMSTVSKHLAILKQAGLIRDERRGKYIFYTLVCPCIVDTFHCIGNKLQE